MCPTAAIRCERFIVLGFQQPTEHPLTKFALGVWGMAFDMYLGEKYEKIDHHEEFIFGLIEDDSMYPELSRIWIGFYTNLVISPQQSNRLIHELLMLLEKANLSENKTFTKLLLRLLPFFSAAYVNDQDIRCAGD
jgi:hypothetical protein